LAQPAALGKIGHCPRGEFKERECKVTNCNPGTNSKSASSMQRVVLPIVLFALTGVATGCFQQFGNPNPASTQLKLTFSPDPALQPDYSTAITDDQLLTMPALGGTPTAADNGTVQVMPTGAVVKADAQSPSVVNAPVTRWVKNTDATTLWSSARPDAAAFTEAPAGSFLRVSGTEDSGRLPVYYVGDGLLRRAGDAWVDATAVETVDAPPPGKVSAVDADARQPLPVWVQAHRATKLWSGPDDKAVTLTDLPQWTFLKVAGLARDGRLLVNFAGDFATRQPGIGWIDQSAVGPAGDPGRWVTNHRSTALWSGVDDKAARFTVLPQWTKLRIVDSAAPNAERMQIQFFGDSTGRQPGVAWIARADIGPITPPVPLPTIPVAAPAAAKSRTPESHTFA
jgi:hypothetical protein